MALQFTAKELIALPPTNPANWIVEGLLRTKRRRPSLLCGFPEAGKSTVAHQLALAVANGVPFLDRKTTQGHVIYWKNEDSQQDVAEDLRRAGLSTNSNLLILLPEPEDRNLDVLASALRQNPSTKLVIVETLADFLNIPDITNNDDCRTALQNFCNLVMQSNPDCAFLLLHHFNKSNLNAELSGTKILGATVISGFTDAKIYLRQISDEDSRRVIHATARKGVGIVPTYLDFDPETLTATLGTTVRDEAIATRQVAKTKRIMDLDSRIQQLVSENPGLSKWVIVSMVGGNGQRVGKHLEGMIHAGFIVTKSGGEKGNAQLLYLPDEESPIDREKKGEVAR